MYLTSAKSILSKKVSGVDRFGLRGRGANIYHYYCVYVCLLKRPTVYYINYVFQCNRRFLYESQDPVALRFVVSYVHISKLVVVTLLACLMSVVLVVVIDSL